VIIGSGAAGIAAAEEIRKQDPQASILMLGEERHGYYSRPGLAYYLTGEIVEEQLFPFSKQDFEHIGLHLLNAQVKHIYPSEHRVALHNGR